jgi:hypothetical protein
LPLPFRAMADEDDREETCTCVDEDALVEALRARLQALPRAALAARMSACGLAEPAGDAPGGLDCAEGRRCAAEALLSPNCAAQQYELGCAVQRELVACSGGGNSDSDPNARQATAAPPPATQLCGGDVEACEVEARAWFLAAARHGHLGAHDAVASYFLTRPLGDALRFRALPPSYHDAVFWLWAGSHKGLTAATGELATLVRNDTQRELMPLATKDLPERLVEQVTAADRQRLVRLLHLGPRLAQAAAAPYEDASAAQFLLAMQHLGTPVPSMSIFYRDFVQAGTKVSTMTICIQLCTLLGGSAATAQQLLRASAAAGYAPAAAFLQDAGPRFERPAALLGALSDELADLLRTRATVGHTCLTLPKAVGRQLTRQLREQRDAGGAGEAAGAVHEEDLTELKAPGRRVPCAHCGRDDIATKQCQRCRAAHYCGTACQRQAWGAHKRVCAVPPLPPR